MVQISLKSVQYFRRNCAKNAETGRKSLASSARMSSVFQLINFNFNFSRLFWKPLCQEIPSIFKAQIVQK